MPREVRTELQDLIDSGKCNWQTTLDITLTGGEELFLSTGEIHVDRFGKDQVYSGKICPDVSPLTMSLDIEVDQQDFKVSNVDLVIGRVLTTSVRKLDAAEAISGILFIDTGLPLTDAIWDAKMLGELVSSSVNDKEVPFMLVSIIDSVIISGRTIASEFQWQEPISNVPNSDPNDNGPTGEFGTGKGRYGEEPILI